MYEDGSCNQEQFFLSGSYGYFFWFSSITKPVIEVFNSRVVLYGCDGWHVEDRSDFSIAAFIKGASAFQG